MSVPKVAIDEDRDAITGQHDIWPSRQVLRMKSVAESRREQSFADDHLQRSAAISDAAYNSAALFRRDFVSHSNLNPPATMHWLFSKP
jgi:hypothetical protein